MSFDAGRLAIEQRFVDNWTATQYEMDNIQIATAGLSAYVKFYVEFGEGKKVGLGPQANRRQTGVITAQVHVKVGAGTKSAMQYADDIAAIWRDANFSGVVCREPYLHRVGESDGWFQVNVLVPFYRDEII